MTTPHLVKLIAGALVVASLAQPALAKDGDLSLTAIVGGALPYSTSAGYVVTRLITPEKDARGIHFTRGEPFGGGVKEVFGARPQFGLGGRYELGRTGGRAKIALKAMVSAAMERPEGERPMVGLAGISLVF